MRFDTKAQAKRQKKWYVLHVETGSTSMPTGEYNEKTGKPIYKSLQHETRIKREIKRRAAIEGCKHLFGKVLSPKVQEIRQNKDGKPVTYNYKRFPGYLVLEAAYCAEVFSILKCIRGIYGTLPHLDRGLLNKEEQEALKAAGDVLMPTPLSDEEAAMAIIMSKKVTGPKEFKPRFTHGEEVIINHGSYRGVEGKITCVNSNSFEVEFKMLGTTVKRSFGQWQLTKK